MAVEERCGGSSINLIDHSKDYVSPKNLGNIGGF